MQIMIPIVINFVEFAIIHVKLPTDNDAIFRSQIIAKARLQFSGEIIHIKIKDGVSRIIFCVSVARKSRESLIELPRHQNAVIPAAYGRFAVGDILSVVLGDFIARV